MQHVGHTYSLSCLKIVKWETEGRHCEDEGEDEGSAVLIRTDKGGYELSIAVCHLLMTLSSWGRLTFPHLCVLLLSCLSQTN